MRALEKSEYGDVLMKGLEKSEDGDIVIMRALEKVKMVISL